MNAQSLEVREDLAFALASKKAPLWIIFSRTKSPFCYPHLQLDVEKFSLHKVWKAFSYVVGVYIFLVFVKFYTTACMELKMNNYHP